MSAPRSVPNTRPPEIPPGGPPPKGYLPFPNRPQIRHPVNSSLGVKCELPGLPLEGHLRHSCQHLQGKEFLRPGLPQSSLGGTMTLKRGGRRATRVTTDCSSDWGAATAQHTHYDFLGIYLVCAGRDVVAAQPSERCALLGPLQPLVLLHFVKDTQSPPCSAG